MRYAIIQDNIVTNIIVLRDANAQDFPEAVSLSDRPVAIGDNYVDGKFYRDSKEILTPTEEVEQYKAALAILGVETEEDANEN